MSRPYRRNQYRSLYEAAIKGKTSAATLKDMESLDLLFGERSNRLTTQEQERAITLPNGKPAQVYTNSDLTMAIVGDDDWFESGAGDGVTIIIYPSDDSGDQYERYYDTSSEGSRDFKALTVDFDNGENLGDIIREYCFE